MVKVTSCLAVPTKKVYVSLELGIGEMSLGELAKCHSHSWFKVFVNLFFASILFKRNVDDTLQKRKTYFKFWMVKFKDC